MAGEKIEIIKVTTSDIDVLQQLSVQTYSETFASFFTEDDMRQYLDEAFNRKQLIEELENNKSAFYFAMVTDKTAGYLKINFGDAQTDVKDNKAMEIERIYALKEFHGKGVGQMLCNKALQVAKEAGVEYIWLGVWEHNYRAQKFYEKNGFVKFGEHIFVMGDDEQTDFLVRLDLKPAL